MLIDRSQSVCCFAASAQLTVPSALRWGLVCQDEGRSVLVLARAVPRTWIEQPNSNLSVVDSPVSRQLLTGGSISFSLERKDTTHAVVASVHTHVVDGGAALQRLSLRLRMPTSWGGIKSVASGTVGDWTTRLQPAKPKSDMEKDVLVLGGTAGVPSASELRGIVVMV